jgi:hypothetical protein
MSFSYSGDPADSTLDAVRFYAQDTDTADQLISDEGINFIITQWTNVTSNPLYLAAAVCDVIASKFAREISFAADGVSVGASELQEKYERLADSLRAQYTASEIGGGPSVGGMLANEAPDYSVEPLVWAKGQHDNPSAGQQDFGGSGAPPNYFPENWVN